MYSFDRPSNPPIGLVAIYQRQSTNYNHTIHQWQYALDLLIHPSISYIIAGQPNLASHPTRQHVTCTLDLTFRQSPMDEKMKAERPHVARAGEGLIGRKNRFVLHLGCEEAFSFTDLDESINSINSEKRFLVLVEPLTFFSASTPSCWSWLKIWKIIVLRVSFCGH